MTSITVPGVGAVEITVTERGEGHPVLLLHGGGGPLTVAPWADRLAAAEHARVLTPTHPGFAGTPRPATLDSVAGLAAAYVALLDALDLHDVTVVGNSIGGWIAAEMTLLHSPRVSSYVLVDAVGIEVPGHSVADFFALTPAEVAERSYYDPATYGIDPAALPPQARAAMAANRATLAVYAGRGMGDPTLAGRLAGATTPTLVVWGEADRIGDPDFGRAFAEAIPGAEFTLIDQAGHLPQIEAPDALIKVVWAFARSRDSER
jgi:pimeloyl-ACP methyl ester carboxylesterase